MCPPGIRPELGQPHRPAIFRGIVHPFKRQKLDSYHFGIVDRIGDEIDHYCWNILASSIGVIPCVYKAL